MKKQIKILSIVFIFLIKPSFAYAAITFSHGWPNGALPSDTTSAMLSFETDQDIQYCRYSTAPNTELNSMTEYFGGWGSSFHFQRFDNLTSGNTYHYYIKCADANWQSNAVDYEISFSIANSPNPSISGVQGAISHGQNITINGSGFGIKSPAAPLLYDLADEQASYGGLKNGDPVPSGGENPWGDSNAFYKTTNPRGKNLVHYSNQWTAESTRRAIVGGRNFLEASNKPLYISYWIHTGADFNPVVDGSGNRNESNKFMRLTQDANWFQEDVNAAVVWNPHATGMTIGTGWYITPQSIYNAMNMYCGWNEIGQIGAWNRNEIIVDNSTLPTKPRVTEKINEKMLLDYQVVNVGDLPQQNITGIGSLGFDSSNAQGAGAPVVDWGEIYVDNTRARVFICNTADWSSPSRNHCEIQIPQGTNTWVNNQIQARVNQGSFADNSSQFLYITDASGNVNASGFPVTFSSGGGDTTAPHSPIALQVW